MTPHLETWANFNTLARWTMFVIVLVLIGMFAFLVPHGKPV
jgi:hypothetical protein